MCVPKKEAKKQTYCDKCGSSERHVFSRKTMTIFENNKFRVEDVFQCNRCGNVY